MSVSQTTSRKAAPLQWGQKVTTVDQVGKYFVFNILGNRYRLICFMSFEKSKVYILHVMTHAEYDRGQWKDI